MVRLSDLIELNEDGMARKTLSHKRYGGLEDPRKGLEQPIEAFQSFSVGGYDAPHTYCMTNDLPEKNCNINEAPMKKLISEELARRPHTGPNAPGVVARLMGVDLLSLDTESSGKLVEKKNEMKESYPPKEEWLGKGSFDQNEACNFDRRNGNLKLNKPKPREHPQEEELQKFKKEFEAWQTKRLKECSEFVELGTNNTDLCLAPRLNKEKLVHCANSMRKRVVERPEELKGQDVTNPHGTCILKLQKNKNEFLAAAQNKSYCARNVKSNLDFQQPLLTGSGRGLDIASAPTNIVILRPVPDRLGNTEETRASSPGVSDDGSSIEELLQEIKERLKCELRGKSFRRSTIATGGRIETLYTEKTSVAKKIAQCIAKQARDSVTRDAVTPLPRSQTMRSYISEIQCDGSGSPELTTSNNARRFVTERLINVMRDEPTHDIHKHGRGSSRSAMQNKEKSRAEEILCTSNIVSDMKAKSDMQNKYFRHEGCNDVMLDQELFHRNLVRSLSAPVSRTSFGKLLLEDQHILTGAHIRRKHEASEKGMKNVKKWRKEKFNLKEKVSRFKYSFVLRGRLFGRKIQSFEEPHGNRKNHMKDLLSATVVSKFYERHENFNEVPPSPASVCSTTNEEFWRQTEYFSPSSTSDVHPLDDSEMPNVFKEISSNLNELRRKLNQLETYDSDETMMDEQPVEEEVMEIDNQPEAFIRDLLVASGLYDGSSDKYLSKWDPLGKPISNQVFEEVEESYMQKMNDDEGSTSDQSQKLNLKLLCDFLNEVLPGVLGVPPASSSFMKKIIGFTSRSPRGKKLLDNVWEIARVYVYPPSDMLFQSLESLLARDLQSIPWDGLVGEDVIALGKDIEYQIIGDLIHEIVNEMRS